MKYVSALINYFNENVRNAENTKIHFPNEIVAQPLPHCSGRRWHVSRLAEDGPDTTTATKLA